MSVSCALYYLLNRHQKNIRKNLEKDVVVKISIIDELKKSNFKEWFEVGSR
ncbi:hypothetical protein MNV_30039 [Candidatus Methanoperedens nitroreducens]|uniref:Uncharacterized protein n=1 Tax=Candidatus Methanoperedens nitratireducens TaxID=1392998 RepID=A0A284VPU8_9EURY|nr:hypothetical protein MNV_30039 [Candidatus Methanoperedens nitroreducens]